MDKHSFPNGKRLVRDTLKPDDNLHYEKFSGGTVKCIEDDILSLNIPLPPLAEQKRIVDEIEKIFATLDDIANQVA